MILTATQSPIVSVLTVAGDALTVPTAG